MESEMIENYDEPKAFGLSLLVHLILFLIASALGLFSIAEQSGQRAPIDVVLYDSGGETGSAAGDAAPAPAPAVTIDDIVVEDKTLPQPEERPQQPQRKAQNTARTAPADAETGSGQAASGGGGNPSVGTGSGTGTGDSSGGTGSGTLTAPPKERVEASLRSEAAPDYPQELIDDDIEGVVTIKILVASDGSVEDVSIESSSGYRAMDKAAVAAGWRFQFNPGDNGRRGVWKKTFRFQLN